MFKFLRSNAKFFYWVIAGTFVAFIFLAWGMDVAGGGGMGAGRAPDAIGEVNGMPLRAWQYEQAVQDLQQTYRRNAPNLELTANQLALVRDQAWDRLVRDAILAD